MFSDARQSMQTAAVGFFLHKDRASCYFINLVNHPSDTLSLLSIFFVLLHPIFCRYRIQSFGLTFQFFHSHNRMFRLESDRFQLLLLLGKGQAQVFYSASNSVM